MVKLKKKLIRVMALVGAASFAFGACAEKSNQVENNQPQNSTTAVSKVNGAVKTNQEDFYDNNVIYQLPDTVEQNEEISVIVELNADSLMDAFEEQSASQTMKEYVTTSFARTRSAQIKKDQDAWIAGLKKTGIAYTVGERYDTILNGFEVLIKAKDFEKVNDYFKGYASLIVGEEYEPAQMEPVHNYVDVYETGIFNSASSKYQGDGVVVAVLDTGLDYTHTAFSTTNFRTKEEDLAFKLDDELKAKVRETQAAKFTQGLTGEDVYVSKKVPFAYDYADKDPDVLPINSEHGTHVAGIIAGQDDEITGVAPNAQLAIMKVFSDAQQGAKDSWILSALEDCVTLGVDVINMSLGSNCGFSREVDKDRTNEIYDSIRDAGISLIAAAGNDYNATHGSTKNGSNGLTSNPDSGPVGSPSTYTASLSVASVDGVKTPYLRYGNDIMYFNEASTSDSETKDFVDDILKTVGGVESYDFEYVAIPGIGSSSDYPEDREFYKGKIVLVKRGTTTFEDKVRVALIEKGAAGIIIYNNVSGTISMSVGEGIGAVCSISQDEGEKLAEAGSGILSISKKQVAGPFMSDFSSWGPTSDLKIKPEITAHGGEIYSAVPGQSYDRLSGTSMAAPNQAGATALIRQYVKYSNVFGTAAEMEADPVRVTKLVNQLMMSTTDIVHNKNGLPYAIRKQGSGLVNIADAVSAAAYLSTFENGVEMDKTKLELGDDKDSTGIYTMKFAINNISENTLTYDLGAIVMTEGVSTTYTSHGDTTVTQDGYELTGAKFEVLGVTSGEHSGTQVTVKAKQSAMVEVRISLGEEDKAYMDKSFKYGMYVEGFITLKATAGTNVDLNVPYLAFYGDWTEAPIFDEEYYDTHKDEINTGLDDEDKLMPDAYATRVVGGLYSDYIATLGSYYFVQDPKATQIAADKNKIALSNQEDGNSSAINSIRSISAGLLRNVKEWNLYIVEDATGEEIFTTSGFNQRKCSSSGNTIYQSSMEVEFSALEHNLKNNTKYTVTVETYIDYGAKDKQANARNVFEFPLYIDFEAPVITGVTYRTEYDKTSKKTHLYADLSVYDNHYAMGLQVGQIIPNDNPETQDKYTFTMQSFGKYITPVYSTFNSTSLVTVEMTDYVAQIKNSCGTPNDRPNNGNEVVYNNNSFIVNCYDYAMNSATYEISLPDEIISMYFDVEEEMIKLSPNETMDLSSVLKIYPNESWLQVLDFTSSNPDLVDVVNQTLIAKTIGESGENTATITAIGYDNQGNKKEASVLVKVLSEGEDGYVGGYTVPEINKFELKGYKVNKAYYSISNEEREIGLTGGTYDFDGEFVLSMFPSESVDLLCTMDSYFPEKTSLTYSVGNSKIATVDNGTIVAQAEGTTIVTVNVSFDGHSTFYSGRVTINVKDPYTTNAIYLMSYKGLGGEVVIPGDRGITTIYAYAFSNYEYVEKDLEAGDVINDEDPYHLKQSFLGEDTITKVVIPEGVTHINEYAFAGLTALEEVVLPSTLVNIGVGAFYGCENLKKINLEHVKFINANAFSGPLKEIMDNTGKVVDSYYAACSLQTIKLDNINAIGNYAFKDCDLQEVVLPESSQSLGIGAFMNNKYLDSVTFLADKVKIGSNVFQGCSQLSAIYINAAVIPSYAFDGCEALWDVTFGKDVAVIGEFAFRGTNVSAFKEDGSALTLEQDGAIVTKDGELTLVAPNYSGNVTTNATSIATGAFADNNKIYRVYANNAERVGAYAFADCTQLREVQLANVTEIGDYAFAGTHLTKTPDLSKVDSIGKYAFASTKITSVTIKDSTIVGDYAFCYNGDLETVTIGSDVQLGEGVFYCPVASYVYDPSKSDLENRYGIKEPYYSHKTYVVYDENGDPVEGQTYDYYYYNFKVGVVSNLKQAVIGDNAVIGDYAFAGNAKMTTVDFGSNITVGDYAFFNNAALVNVDLSSLVSIGEQAFSGGRTQAFWLKENAWNYAFDYEYVNGELRVKDYMYNSFAPAFTHADLSNATYIGKGAFAYNEALSSVQFATKGLTEISDFAFAGTKLVSLELPVAVTKLGDYAFFGSNVEQMNLTSVETIGKYAFAETPLKRIQLHSGGIIGDYAFAYCDQLKTVENINNVYSLGVGAFYAAGLETVDLKNVYYIGDYAFGESAVKEIIFGDCLKNLGENPFYGCQMETFGKKETVIFNGEEAGTRLIETYDVSESVKIINGVLYQIVANGGMELVSYPMCKANETYTVEEGTVRISAKAFANSAIKNVTLASTLKALGDKAFYGCENLSIVVFQGYQAPMLEEEYDVSYISYETMPLTGYLGKYQGLGIAPYYMWNAASNHSNFYFGANFVDHIGQLKNKLVMVKPANGQYYDSFIMSQYFGATVLGMNAATEATLKVIALIETLPTAERVTLEHESEITKVREAYNKLPSVEQQALVSNYSKLEAAESMLEYLKSRTQQTIIEEPIDEGMATWEIVLIVVGGVLVLGGVATGITIFVVKKKNRK